MNYHPTSAEEIRALRSDRERVAELLARYPHVTEDEAGTILDFMRTGRHLDVGLLTSNDRIRPQLDAFMTDHKAHFRIKWLEGAAVTAAIAAILAIFWLIWEAAA